jgi:sugar transferase (PEP-CTERM/EpsH1 system associated)
VGETDVKYRSWPLGHFLWLSGQEVMRILAICPEPPYPPDQGGRIRMYNILKRLAQKHEVHLVAVARGKVPPDIWTVLQKIFASVSLFDFSPSKTYLAIRLLQSLILLKPYILYKNTPPGLKIFLESKIREFSPDILLVDFHYLLESIPAKSIPKVVVLHNLDHILYSRFAAESGLSAKKLHGIMQTPLCVRLEKKLPKLFDHCITMSQHEDQILRTMSGSVNTTIIPNGVDTDFFAPTDKPANFFSGYQADLVFFGTMDYYPNIDGVIFLMEKIMPIIWSKNPQVTLNIVGRNPGNKIRSYAHDSRIRIIGGVDDIRPYVYGAKVVVVPLRMGGGTRLKALEAAAMGKAIVGTSIGLEGLNFLDKIHALIADAPSNVAEQILFCLNSESARNSLGFQARKFVEENYNWDFCTNSMENVLVRYIRRK